MTRSEYSVFEARRRPRRLWTLPALLAVATLAAGCGERGGDGAAARTAAPQEDVAPAGRGAGEGAALVEQLRVGGHVLVMRHARTETVTDLQESIDDPCEKQRNLSEAGREQARGVGEAIRSLDIPIGEVRASPLCRTDDTAALAFGDVTRDRRLVSPGLAGTIEDDDRRARQLVRTVERHPPDGENLVLVTHTGNIGALGESINEGEMLIYRAGELVRRLSPGDWAALARGEDPP